MQIELDGAAVALDGDANPLAEAALAALQANGGRLAEPSAADILLVSCPLRPGKVTEDARSLHSHVRKTALAMSKRDNGRIIFLVSAIAGMPMRRHPNFSIENAAILAGMRALAMEFGPKVLVNAVGFGAVQDGPLVSGDKAMLSHTPAGRSGTIEEAVAAVLFFCDPLNTYTTGQMLSVDGGWMAGYGRNF